MDQRLIAYWHGKGSAGVAELEALATRGPLGQRQLATRALGRVGGEEAVNALMRLLADGSNVESAVADSAATAIGVAASLDELGKSQTELVTLMLIALEKEKSPSLDRVIEAAGRAGDATVQPSLARQLREGAPGAEAAAIALGRHGRRKIALSPEARTALATAVGHARPAVRYAAVWALGREHIPPDEKKPGDGGSRAAAPDAPTARSLELVTEQLGRAITDADPETRAQAIAALVRRKHVAAAADKITAALDDADWRVAVEAMRAATGEHGTAVLREAALRAIGRRFAALERGDGREAHVAIEGLRSLALTEPDLVAPLAAFAKRAAASQIPPLARGWIACFAELALARRSDDFAALERCGPAEFPAHLRLPLVAELIRYKAPRATARALAPRRAALGKLLEHTDPRVRAAGLGALAALWPDGSDADRRATVAALIGALGASDPMIAGTAVETTTEIYPLLGDRDPSALDAAIVARAGRERDVELSTALFDLIAKHKITAGAAACATGLADHPVRVRAATACLTALGEPPPPGRASPTARPLPRYVDPVSVVDQIVQWNLVTSRGPITIELHPNDAPWAVASIVALSGKGFYDGLEFHRVVPDFVVQGGDPQQTGWGGPGYSLPAEPSGDPSSLFTAGGVGIADAGRDSGGSQWFIMHARAPHLDGRYTHIGRVIKGQEIADSLLIGDRVVRASASVSPQPQTLH